MNKEYEIYYEAFDIKDLEERRKFILEKSLGDQKLFDDIMKLFPDEEIEDDIFGKYKIDKEIGKGGMGIVYLASFSETFGSESFTRKVALKTISPEFKLDAKGIKIFLQEIKTLAELDHPNIAGFLDIGTSEKGKPFFVMEYVDGVSLIEYCNQKRFSITERLSFFREVLAAISYSHSKGFIHCDIKPNNILVDSNGTPKVIDFGIASKYGSFIADKNSQTTFFQHAFTLNYASPEQIKGERNLSEATDIYSLGAVLYELLTGQLPIIFDETKSYSELIQTSERNYPTNIKKSVTKAFTETEIEQILLERDCKTISDLRNDLTNDLDEIVQKAISKKTSSRYKNVKEFDSQIEEFLDDESFFSQIKRAFVSLYKRYFRKLRRVSLKWAIASTIVLLIFIGVLSQNQTVRTIPYYLQFKFAQNDGKIAVSLSQKQAIENTRTAIKQDLAKRFEEALSLYEQGNTSDQLINPWGLANIIVALGETNYQFDSARINKILDSSAFGEECWKEEKVACKTVVSGWMLLAKSYLKEPLTDKQMEFVFRTQSEEGWFPAYPYPQNSANASTYPTDILIFGFTKQLELNLVKPQHQERVNDIIKRGTLWLLKTHQKNSLRMWKDCPTDSESTESIGLDGNTIFTLHQVAKTKSLNVEGLNEQLKEIDSIWLDNLSSMKKLELLDSESCRCTTKTGEELILDRTTQWSVPWAIMATAEAMQNATPWQKAVATKWLENLPLAEEYKGPYFGAAEYLISLNYLFSKLN